MHIKAVKGFVKLVTLFLVIVFMANFVSFKIAQRQARDRQRVLDIGAMEEAARAYKRKYGFFPPSQDGKFFACINTDLDPELQEEIKNKKITGRERLILIARPCDWGVDYLGDIDDISAPKFLKTIPTDPFSFKGVEYVYVQQDETFKLFAYLEGSVDTVQRMNLTEGVQCGNKLCNLMRVGP